MHSLGRCLWGGRFFLTLSFVLDWLSSWNTPIYSGVVTLAPIFFVFINCFSLHIKKKKKKQAVEAAFT